MTMSARFSSTCPRCGGQIDVGEPIEYTRGQPATHAACPANPTPPDVEELPIPQERTRAGRMLIAGQLDATITMQNGEHFTVYARALRRNPDGSWDRASLTDPGARVRVAAAKRGQRIGWIGEHFAIDWDRDVTDATKDAVRALFGALTGHGIAEHLPDVDNNGRATTPGAMTPTDPERAQWAVIQVANRCGHCDRELTRPESIERGYGPDCAGKLGYDRPEHHGQVKLDAEPQADRAPRVEPARLDLRHVVELTSDDIARLRGWFSVMVAETDGSEADFELLERLTGKTEPRPTYLEA